MKVKDDLINCFLSLFISGVYVAIVPILMEQSEQDVISLHSINFTDVTLKFLAVMQPNKTCLHHQALEL